MPKLVRFLLMCFAWSELLFAQYGSPRTGKTADLNLTAVGRQHHPIHTESREAQEYFDQGITQCAAHRAGLRQRPRSSLFKRNQPGLQEAGARLRRPDAGAGEELPRRP